MSESDIVRVRNLPDGSVVQVMPDGSTRPIEDRTDWARLEAMSEDDIEANALADPDNPPLSADELARMRQVPDPERIRQQLGLTQAEFAEQFEVSLLDLKAWEGRERWLDTTAITLFRIIEQDPDAVRAALRRTYEPRLRPTGD